MWLQQYARPSHDTRVGKRSRPRATRTSRRARTPRSSLAVPWRTTNVVPSAQRIVSHPEGNTPLLHRPALDRYAGLADVRVIRALYRSADSGRPVSLEPFSRDDRPSLEQMLKRPPVQKPELVNTEAPSE